MTLIQKLEKMSEVGMINYQKLTKEEREKAILMRGLTQIAYNAGLELYQLKPNNLISGLANIYGTELSEEEVNYIERNIELLSVR